MALNGNFISFQSIIEKVYRQIGHQTIDWGQAMEIIGETIGLIGALPAYKDVTTNGVGDNPNPIEIVDYKAQLPSDYVAIKAARRVILTEEQTDEGTNLRISRYIPMVEATDQFYQSIRDQWSENMPSGTYNYTAYTQVETITLTGESGTAIVSVAGDLTKTVTFDTDLTTTAANFVTANDAEYLTKGIVLTSSGANITFTSNVSGTYFAQPVITNDTGDLNGTVVGTRDSQPVIIYGPEYKVNYEAQYEYKTNNGFIYTNFEDGTGFVEMVYTAFVTDEHGFPMVPADERYVKAITWSIIREIHYLQWIRKEITRDVFEYSDRERDWYIASARSKASVPSLDKMEAIKNMFLRSIPKVNAHDTYFKYINVQEQRYTQNQQVAPIYYFRG